MKILASELINETQGSFVEVIEDLCTCRTEARRITTALLEAMKETLLNGHSILLTNVGSLGVKQKKERGGVRNPKTGEECFLAARKVVTLGSHSVNTRLPRGYICRAAKERLSGVTIHVIEESFKRLTRFIATVAQGDRRVEFRGLGVFYPTFKEGRMVRNPSTDEMVFSEEKILIRFKCSKLLLEKLNK